ncbi:MAG TPA: UDP-N-acetylmuramoyl-tripeptide--D-alanyl-D-alanine ligase [Epulopiscium sp.]|nr:UDP-N-acetylmuramoyl-tripeptide--D-alanyl-D-alanine ligase [Candidatus Epulonipiscium sp.]
MESLTLEQIVSAVEGSCLNRSKNDNISITSVSIDSREIKKNSLYIPIKGEKFDGHVFIEAAFNKGATIALTENKLGFETEGILIYVKDTKKALMNLATYYRSLFDIPVVAITGSVGKTSTKDLVSAVLSSKYNVHKTQGNFNNEIGLPLTIFGMTKNHHVLVVEMGMNHFGEIHNLSLIARPHIAIITNIGVSHIENLGSREGILKAKCEILDGMSKEGVLIINGEDDLLESVQAPQKLITYGRDRRNLFFAENIKNAGIEGVMATFNTPNGAVELVVPGLGEHMIDNALAAIAVAKQLKLSDTEIKTGFKLYEPTKMRMDLQLAKNNVYIINDTYNASPDSMKAALKVLQTIPNFKRRIAILGDMFEMGEHATLLHKEVGAFIGKEKMVDLLITVGEISRNIQVGAIDNGLSSENTLHFKNQQDLVANLKELINSGDLVLVKASRGMALEKTVDEIGKVNLNEA